MIFLSVLCVVLYLRSGVSAYAHNNENAQYYNNFNAQRAGSVQSNIAPNSGINWQIQAEEKERNRLINSPEYDNLQRKIHLNEASIGSKNMGQQQGFHQDQILPSYVNSYQDIRGNENIVNEQEANRRENILQGFSSEYVRHQPIQNMNTQPLRAQEYVKSSMLNDGRLINKHNQIEPHFISRDILRHPINLRDFNSEQTQLVQNINELPLKKQENVLHTLPDSRYINTLPIKQINEQLLKPRDDISEFLKHQPIQNIKDPNRFINSKPIINQPVLKQEEETRLELEGISPEYIESLINQKAHESLSTTRSLQNSYQNINTPLEVTEELNNNQYNLRNQQIDKVSTFQNPSAEILYKMQKALPYETELPSPGDNNLKNILNNLKRGQEFYSSPSSNKRYMVIYPNGNVEYVDQIAKIIENHPNYVMVKSEDYLKHLEDRSKIYSMPFIPQIKQNLPINTIQPATIRQEYNEENHNIPEIKLDQASISENPAPYLDSSLITSTEKQDLTLTTTAPETYTFKNSPLASLIVNTVPTTPPHKIIEQDNISNLNSQNFTVKSTLTPIATSTENSIIISDENIIDKKLITKPISDSETNKTVITESVSGNFAATHISQQKIEQDNMSNPESQNITVSSILTSIETRTENTINKSDAYIIDEKLITKPISDSETNKTVITEPVSDNFAATNISQQKIEQDNMSNPESKNITVSSILTPIETRTENTINKSDAYIIDEKLITKPISDSETNKTVITEPVSDNFTATNISQQKIEQDNMSNPESQNITVSGILTPIETSTENTINKSDAYIIDEKLITKPISDSETNKTVITEPVSDNFTATNISQQKIEQDNMSNPESQNITVSSTLTPIEKSTENTKNKNDDDIIDNKLIKNPTPNFETNNTEISEFEIQPQNIQNLSHDQFNGEESYNTVILPRNHEVLPNNSSKNIPKTAEYISSKTSTEKQVTTTLIPVLDETKISNASRSDFHNDTEIASPSSDKTNPESTSFSQDIEKVDNSTGFWFEADEDFWDNIMTGNKTQNQFYFIIVPPKPSIEKETKTTVFSNGTTIVEVIETITKDGEPEILKTTKITHANCTS